MFLDSTGRRFKWKEMCSFLLLSLGVIQCWGPPDAEIARILGTRRLEGSSSSLPRPSPACCVVSDMHPFCLGHSHLENEGQQSAL